MKVKSEIWTIKKLISQKVKINPKPQYQRTSVWTPPKKKLLIDSILRGYDLPKFYITETPNDPHYKWEVTDGQQRMRAIWEFVDNSPENSYNLNEAEIDGLNTKGLSYDDLKKDHKKFSDRFLNFELHFSIIKQATPEEVRSLFARLQMGERLNPAELRHAIASNIGAVIFSITENHNFFKECKIPNGRYKHQDYLDHIFTQAHYDGARNLKAADMRQLYTELANQTMNSFQPLLKKVNRVLDLMTKINLQRKGMFKNKWAFVDTFNLLFQNLDTIKDVKPKNFSDNFNLFEQKRRQNNSSPEILIEDKSSLNYDKNMYDYIIAFKTSGAEKNNVKIRYRVFQSHFLNADNFTFNS